MTMKRTQSILTIEIAAFVVAALVVVVLLHRSIGFAAVQIQIGGTLTERKRTTNPPEMGHHPHHADSSPHATERHPFLSVWKRSVWVYGNHPFFMPLFHLSHKKPVRSRD